VHKNSDTWQKKMGSLPTRILRKQEKTRFSDFGNYCDIPFSTNSTPRVLGERGIGDPGLGGVVDPRAPGPTMISS
jgi:hypothetical protein